MDVMELLGPSASPIAIFDKINNKYGIKEGLKDEQGMLAFLKRGVSWYAFQKEDYFGRSIELPSL